MWPRSRRLRLIMSLAMTLSTACHSWQVPALEPQAVIEELQPTAVQVRQADGTRFVLRQPTLAGDMLLGHRADTLTSVRLVTADQLAVRRFSAGKTALLVGSILGGTLVLGIISCAVNPCGY